MRPRTGSCGSIATTRRPTRRWCPRVTRGRRLGRGPPPVPRRRPAGRPGPRAAAPDGARPGSRRGARARPAPRGLARPAGRSSSTRSSRSAAVATRPMSRARVSSGSSSGGRARHVISLAPPAGRVSSVDAAARVPGNRRGGLRARRPRASGPQGGAGGPLLPPAAPGAHPRSHARLDHARHLWRELTSSCRS